MLRCAARAVIPTAPRPWRCAITSAFRTRTLATAAAAAVHVSPENVGGQSALSGEDQARLSRIRNIGISAHIDSGKTTLTERVLYYTGRIREIHEVRGKDQVGAKMDFMELEREKGITIQSAATHCSWNGHEINIIDTPGHVDFTIEVERALRVLDGAVLVLCAVSGVQSQTITVDRQMKRYDIPRISFVNKVDRAGSNPERVIDQIRKKLKISAAALQVPIGLEDRFAGVVDLVHWRALYNDGARGETVRADAIPASIVEHAQHKRAELIAALADVDDVMADLFLNEQQPTPEQLQQAIRRATLARTFSPVLVGSAIKDKGVQMLLDAVCDYLPTPAERHSQALDLRNDEAKVDLVPASSSPFVGLAFKLEEGRYGQLTYVKVYQGCLRKGAYATHVRSGKRVKIARLVRMHANEMEEIDEAAAGEICALFGIDCASGDTFVEGNLQLSMTSMFVPQPVVSLSLTPQKDSPNFSKALNRFQKEDPTFRVHIDPESKETIISGMGELHLDIYVERMRREYNVECQTGKPQVAFRETVTQPATFNYTHKKQSGGAGQFGRVIGRIEPIDLNSLTPEEPSVEFVNQVIGGNIPTNYIPACEKGFMDALERGNLIGHPVTGVRYILEDGLAHSVDSSELAFRLAAQNSFRDVYSKARPIVLEPIMTVSITAPVEFQGAVLGAVNRRKGTIVETEVQDEYFTAEIDAPLNNMFGFATELRSSTQGKGEFTMEYKRHAPVLPNVQEELTRKYRGQA